MMTAKDAVFLRECLLSLRKTATEQKDGICNRERQDEYRCIIGLVNRLERFASPGQFCSAETWEGIAYYIDLVAKIKARRPSMLTEEMILASMVQNARI